MIALISENFYSTGIMHQLGVPLKTAATFNVFLLRLPTIMFILSTLVLIKRLNSRPYLLSTLVGGLISITLLFLAQVYDHFKPDSEFGAAIGITAFFCGMSSWHLGAGFLPKFLPGQCCPQVR